MKKLLLIVLFLSAGLWAYADCMGHGDMKDDAAGKGMMADHEKMMADVKAMDAKLDEMVAAMNAATGDKKVEAIGALVTEMIAQRKKMQGMMMMAMHHPMMPGCGEHHEGGCCGEHHEGGCGGEHKEGGCPMMQQDETKKPQN